MARVIVALAASIVAVACASARGAETSTASHGPGKNGFSSFAVDPHDERVVYAATGNGIFKSVDAGESWHASSDGLTSRYVFDVVIDQHEPTTLYAATDGGIFKSIDAGRDWHATRLRSTSITVAVDPRDSTTLYAAADSNGVFKSTDGGQNWRLLFVDPSERFYALAINPRHSSTVYAGAGSGVFKAVNGERFSLPPGGRVLPNDRRLPHRQAEGFVTSLAMDPRRPSILYLGCDYGVFKSVKSGAGWHRASKGLVGTTPKFRLVGSLVLNQHQPRTLYAGLYPGGVFKTTDAGAHWRLVGLRQAGYILSLALAPQDSSTIYAASSGGNRHGTGYRSDDGGRTWQPLSIPLPG